MLIADVCMNYRFYICLREVRCVTISQYKYSHVTLWILMPRTVNCMLTH